MSLNSTQWGFFARMAYRAFRPMLVTFVAQTDNQYDDKLIDALDVITGYNPGR